MESYRGRKCKAYVGQTPGRNREKIRLEISRQPHEWSLPYAYTIEGGQTRITVVSDLEQRAKEGWKWEIPAGSARDARFALILQQTPSAAPPVLAPGIAPKIAQAARATRDMSRGPHRRGPRNASKKPSPRHNVHPTPLSARNIRLMFL